MKIHLHSFDTEHTLCGLHRVFCDILSVKEDTVIGMNLREESICPECKNNHTMRMVEKKIRRARGNVSQEMKDALEKGKYQSNLIPQEDQNPFRGFNQASNRELA